MSTHKIDDLLDEGHRRFTPLQRLLKTATDQKLWTAQLRAVLDDSLKLQVEVTDVRGDTAHLLCASAAIATRLRFVLPDLKQDLESLQSFSRVTDYKIRVSSTR